MLETILVFLSSNVASVIVVIGAMIVMWYLWKEGYKKNVCLYILTLIGKAEIKFEHGENKEKLESVITGIYNKFPNLIKFFYTRDDLVNLINGIVAETKEWLQNQSK